jgi:hypothetical protein
VPEAPAVPLVPVVDPAAPPVPEVPVEPVDDPSSLAPHPHMSATMIGAHALRVRRFEESMLVPPHRVRAKMQGRDDVVSSCRALRESRMQLTSNANAVRRIACEQDQLERELCGENAICERWCVPKIARSLFEILSLYCNRKAICTAGAVQAQHSLLRHTFARCYRSIAVDRFRYPSKREARPDS